MNEAELKILTEIIQDADTSKTEIAKNKWFGSVCKIISEMHIHIQKQHEDIDVLKKILLTAAERMEYIETFLDSTFGDEKDNERTLH